MLCCVNYKNSLIIKQNLTAVVYWIEFFIGNKNQNLLKEKEKVKGGVMNWRFTSEEKNMFRSLPRALLLCEKNLIEIQSGHEKICLDSIHEIGVGEGE